jgi:hypothetical protein
MLRIVVQELGSSPSLYALFFDGVTKLVLVLPVKQV